MMKWSRIGSTETVTVPGSSIYPDLIDGAEATYTNILQVFGRQSDMYYRCETVDGAEHRNHQDFMVTGKVVTLLLYS